MLHGSRLKESTSGGTVFPGSGSRHRSTEAPMDFSYERPQATGSFSPRGVGGGIPNKRSHEGIGDQSGGSKMMGSPPQGQALPSAASSSYHFGSTSSPSPFLFHQPIPPTPSILMSPTVSGPEVEMSHATPPNLYHASSSHLSRAEGKSRISGERATVETQEDEEEEEEELTPTKRRGSSEGGRASPVLSSRPMATGALTRVRRRRSLRDRSPQRRGGSSARSRQARVQDQDEEDWSSEDGGTHRETARNGAGDGDSDRLHKTDNKFLSVQYFLPPSLKEVAQETNAALSRGTPLGGVHHMDWPELLLSYAQLAFNASLLLAFLYTLYAILMTIRQDVKDKMKEYTYDIISEIQTCSLKYQQNRCGTDLQAPALESMCLNWDRCRSKDPTVVGHARVAAETFAEIMNGFVDVVSWKSMLFTLLTLIIVVGATNSTLSFFRLRSRIKSSRHLQAQQDDPRYIQQQHYAPVRANGSQVPSQQWNTQHTVGGIHAGMQLPQTPQYGSYWQPPTHHHHVPYPHSAASVAAASGPARKRVVRERDLRSEGECGIVKEPSPPQ